MDVRRQQRAAARTSRASRRTSLAGAVLPTVAGTPQAQEAVIANSIPQTATVPLGTGRSSRRTSTARRSTRRSPARRCRTSSTRRADHPGVAERLLRGDGGRVVHRGAAHRAVVVATSVPAGDLHDSAVLADPLRDLRAHLRGDAAGRLRRLHAGLPRHRRRADGHRRLRHRLRLLAVDRHVWYAPPYTYGVAARRSTTRTSASPTASRWASRRRRGPSPTAAAPTTIPATGAAIPAARRRAPTCTATGARRRSPARARWYAGGGVAGTTFSGSYATPAAPSGKRQRRPPVQRVDRQRVARLRPHVQRRRAVGQRGARQQLQHLHRPAHDRDAASVTGAGGSTYNRAGTTTAGPEGNAHVGGGSTYNAKTGNTNTWATASVGNNHYADVNGNVYKNTGDGWEQHRHRLVERRVRRHLVGEQGIAGARTAMTAPAASAPASSCGFTVAIAWRWRLRRLATASAVAASGGSAASAAATLRRWRLRRPLRGADSVAVASAAVGSGAAAVGADVLVHRMQGSRDHRGRPRDPVGRQQSFGSPVGPSIGRPRPIGVTCRRR